MPHLSIIVATALLSLHTLALPTQHDLAAHPKREILTCGMTPYSPDEYYCDNTVSPPQLIAILPHGVDGSELPAPQNQPQPPAQAPAPVPAPIGTIPHEGTVHTDDGSGSSGGTGTGGSGNGGSMGKIRRQQGIETLPHGVGGSALTGTGAWQQPPSQSTVDGGDESVPVGVDGSLGRVHVDGNGSGS